MHLNPMGFLAMMAIWFCNSEFLGADFWLFKAGVFTLLCSIYGTSGNLDMRKILLSIHAKYIEIAKGCGEAGKKKMEVLQSILSRSVPTTFWCVGDLQKLQSLS
jgi:hypothetical protein